jgi:hypothetical protein
MAPRLPAGRAIAIRPAITGSGSLSVHLFHKAAEDAGDGTDVNGAITISASAVGRTTATAWGGLEDLVRYRFTLTPGGEEPSWLLFRMLPPNWFNSVKV